MDVMKKFLHILQEIVQNEENAKYVHESILLVCMGSSSHQRDGNKSSIDDDKTVKSNNCAYMLEIVTVIILVTLQF